MELAAALGTDVAQHLPEEGAEHTVDQRQLQGVDEGVLEVAVLEDAGHALHDVGIALADPIVQREVFQRVHAFLEHAALDDQDEHRHDDADDEEDEQDDGDDGLPAAQADERGPAALAAHGGVGLPGADELLVDEHGQRRDADHQNGHGESRLGVLGLGVGVQLAGQRPEADGRAQVIDGAEGADGLGEGQDDGGQHGGHHQGQRDLPQDQGLAGALDLAHLLQLGVDGVQRRGDQQVCIGVIVQRQYDDDGDGAVCHRRQQRFDHLVGNTHVRHDGGHETGGAADTGRLKHTQPGLGLHPGGNHVGDDDRQGEEGLEGQVAADHEPRQNGAQQNGTYGNADADQQGVQQRLDEQVHGQVTGQQPLPVIERELARYAARHVAQIALGQLEGRGQHVHQREDDQIHQQDDGDQYDHIVRIRHHCHDLVFQPPGLGIILLIWFHRVQVPSLS